MVWFSFLEVSDLDWIMLFKLIAVVDKFWKYLSKVPKSGFTDDFNSFSRGTKILLNTKLTGTNTSFFWLNYTLKGIGTTLKAVTLGFSTVNSTNVQVLPNSMYYV